MKISKHLRFLALLVAGLVPAMAHAAPTECAALTGVKVPGMTVLRAEPAEREAKLPATCRESAVLRPSTDSEIHIAVWLPASDAWNGKYQAVGNGGWGGSINTVEMAEALARGYATSSTDTGHSGGRASFAPGHPEKLIDFGYRSVHEMTVAAKALIAAYYGQPAKLAYFVGCSSGGRQALMEAQRFPQDYDGIVAGAATNNITPMMAERINVAQATLSRPEDYIDPALYPVIHAAVLKACPLHAGVLDDAFACRFDPQVLACQSGETKDCLTAPQVSAAQRIYKPLTDSRTGEVIFPPMERGSELVWKTLAGGPQPIVLADDFFRYIVFDNPQWDFRTLNFDSDIALAHSRADKVLASTDPDLRPFFAHGGKLLQYHGMTDQQVMPGNSVNYANAVRRAVGATTADAAYRLYLVPGMNHCGGGDGPSHFDMLGALEQWREQGRAPETIPASHQTDGKADRTRNLCPYPQISSYNGSGDEAAASSYSCRSEQPR